MREPDPLRGGGRLDRVLLLFLLALFLFASPFTSWWAYYDAPWYFPFVLWAGLIALVAFERYTSREENDA